MEFLGHQILGDVITPSSDNLEKVKWNEVQERAYSLLKEYLLQEPVLKLPDLIKPFVLRTDASGVRVAAVLCRRTKESCTQ